MDDLTERELEGESLDFVEAEFANIRQSTIRSVEGGHIELQQVGALSIDGERIEATQSASAILRGKTVNLNQGISLLSIGGNNELKASFSPVMLSKDRANINSSAVGIVGARDINVENSSTLMIIANKVEGNVTTLLDWRSALALGAVAGGVLGLITLLKRK